MANKSNDMSHTKWVCKYHIVFTPKYRRKAIYNQYKESIRDILKQLCAYKGVEILEGKLMIMRKIWGPADDGGIKKLQVNMANIRKKIGSTPGDNKYIINELGVGYRIGEEIN